MRQLFSISFLLIFILWSQSGLADQIPFHLYGDRGPIGITYEQAVDGLSDIQHLSIQCDEASADKWGTLKCIGLYRNSTVLFSISGKGKDIHNVVFTMRFPVDGIDVKLQSSAMNKLVGNIFGDNDDARQWFQTSVVRVKEDGGYLAKTFDEGSVRNFV